MPILRYWGTTSEILFLNGLGTYKFECKTVAGRMTVEELLENYLIAAKRRKEWGGIDKAEVVAHARELLARARRYTHVRLNPLTEV